MSKILSLLILLTCLTPINTFFFGNEDQERIDKLEKINKRLRRRIKGLKKWESSYKDLKEEFSKLYKQVEVSKKSDFLIRELRKKLAEEKKKNRILQRKLESSDCDQLNINDIVKENKVLKNDNSKLFQDNRNLLKQNSQMKLELYDLKRQIKDVSKVEVEYNNTKFENEDLKSVVSKLRKFIAQRKKKFDKLKKKYLKLKVEYETVKKTDPEEFKKLKDDKEILQFNYQNALEEIDSLIVRNGKLVKTIKASRKDIAVFKIQIDKMAEKISKNKNYKEEALKYEKKVFNLQHEYSQCQSALKRLQYNEFKDLYKKRRPTEFYELNKHLIGASPN